MHPCPFSQGRIPEVLRKSLSFTLNQDEAIARVALQLRYSSPRFRVRDFAIHDVVNYHRVHMGEVTDIPRRGYQPDGLQPKRCHASTRLPYLLPKEDFNLEAKYSRPEDSLERQTRGLEIYRQGCEAGPRG